VNITIVASVSEYHSIERCKRVRTGVLAAGVLISRTI
jgi:hypothetical protein